MAEAETIVRLINIGKAFVGVPVLTDVNLAFRAGEIHALIGENGAGKSTVGKIVGGYYSRSSGDLEVFGERVGAWDPAQALARGIAMMHQELQLVPDLTVAENVFLGIEHNARAFLRRNEAERLAEIIDICGFSLDPRTRTRSLPIAEQQKIEIMRAIAREARVIVMDEPTSSLTDDEVERLHLTMRRLKQMGRTILYVSHFLDHVLAHADRVTIMREGRVVRSSLVGDETKASLVAGMLGRSDADVAYPRKHPPVRDGREPVVSARGLSAPTGITDVSLDIYPGEIVGLIGLVGSGRSEIARALFGADPASAGEVRIAGELYADRSPAASVERGIAFVPEDRRKQGLVLTQSVRSNMTLPHLPFFSRSGFLRRHAEIAKVSELIRHLGVTPNHVDGAVAAYSGGNQQKVLLAKWILRDPRVVILDEPSRGVDLGARRRIHEFIVELAGNGAGVLMISSEIEEVLGLAHRAYLVNAGRIIGEVDPEATSTDRVLWSLFHAESVPKSLGA